MTGRYRSMGVGATLAALLGSALVVSAQAAPTQYTLEMVKAHNSAKDCWSVVRGEVYDFTKWIDLHSGGAAVIVAMCGIDATVAFDKEHAEDRHGAVAPALNEYRLGTLVASVSPTPSPTATASPSATPSAGAKRFTIAQVQRHRTAADCWTVVQGGAYNVTPWVKVTANRNLAKAVCGKDASAVMAKRFGSAAKARSGLAKYRLGALG